jgi:hypothetical protein
LTNYNNSMNLTMVETGATPGYEDYHGYIFDSLGNEIGTWNYDKNQCRYITSIERSGARPKKIYACSVEHLKINVEHWLTNKSKEKQD